MQAPTTGRKTIELRRSFVATRGPIARKAVETEAAEADARSGGPACVGCVFELWFGSIKRGAIHSKQRAPCMQLTLCPVPDAACLM